VNSPIENLENVLKFVMLKVGLRAENLPSKEEKAVLIDHIISGYGNHTIEEIRLAFDMALSYKLGLPEKEIICYENFSCLYFSKIMNAYRVWAIEVHKYISHKKVPLIEQKKELTPGEWDEWLNDIKNYEFNLLPCSAYDYLVKINKINLSVKEKNEFMERAKAHLLASIDPNTKDYFDYLAMKKKKVFSKPVTATLITISKRFALSEYFKNN